MPCFGGISGRSRSVGRLGWCQTVVVDGGLCVGVKAGANCNIERHNGVPERCGFTGPFVKREGDGPVDLDSVSVLLQTEGDFAKTVIRIDGEADLEHDW